MRPHLPRCRPLKSPLQFKRMRRKGWRLTREMTYVGFCKRCLSFVDAISVAERVEFMKRHEAVCVRTVIPDRYEKERRA